MQQVNLFYKNKPYQLIYQYSNEILNDYPHHCLTSQCGNLIGSAERCFSPMQSEAARWVIALFTICALNSKNRRSKAESNCNLKIKLDFQPAY